MACCGKASKRINVKDPLGGYRYLKAHQIKARLEVFKKNNCKDCDKRYTCDYNKYLSCKGKTPK